MADLGEPTRVIEVIPTVLPAPITPERESEPKRPAEPKPEREKVPAKDELR